MDFKQNKNVLIERNSISKLPDLLSQHQKILVFSSKKFVEKIKDTLEKSLNNRETVYFKDFTTNPKKEEVDSAVEQLRGDYNAIIAIGGGSVIDFAKLYKYFTKTNAALIAIPTTAGTGSEATCFAVMYKDGIKFSVEDKSILPDYAVIDSQLLDNSPLYLKACTAADALSQGLESFWSNRSTVESKEYAKEAIILCKNNIIPYVNSDNSGSADNMALAAYLSGKAINISKTTASHAVSYTLTSKYGIPHGHAVALTIPNLFKPNFNVSETTLNDTRGIAYVKENMTELSKIVDSTCIKTIFEKTDLEMNLNKFGNIDLEDIIKDVNMERLKNNPRTLTKNELKDLFSH